MKQKADLIVGINEHVSPGRAIFLGFQHILSMDLYVFPILLAGMIGLSGSDASYLIQMCFFTCGLATIIQTGLGIQLPVDQGSSFVALSALAAIGSTQGMDVLVGSLIPGAILLCLLGVTKVFAKIIHRCVPAYIGGLVIMIVGISLTSTAASGVISNSGGLLNNLIPGLSAMIVLLILNIYGYKTQYKHKYISLFSVIIALVIGCMVSGFMGTLHFDAVGQAAWFQIPSIFHYGLPQFDASSCILMIFIYFIVLIETTGVWFTVSDVTGEELTDERLNRAVIGEGIGCLLGACFGGTPLTGYSSNAGVISITKIGSRSVVITCGILLSLMGLCPKLMAVIASVPGCVISGVFLVICQILIANGLKIVMKEEMSQKRILVIGLSIVFTVSSMVISADAMASFPTVVQYFLSSGTAVGGLSAVLLNLLLPEDAPALKQKEVNAE